MLFVLAFGCSFSTDEPEVMPPRPAMRDSIPSGPAIDPVVEPLPGTCDFRGNSGAEETDRCTGGRSVAFVVNGLRYPDVRVERGVEMTAGFDLDGRDSSRDDAEGCFFEDFVSPDGRFGGIDNQAAPLKPSFDAFLRAPLSVLFDEAAREGRFLTVIELAHVDGPNDDCVEVSVFDAEARDPLRIDDAGRLEAGQTFVVTQPRSYLNARIVEGELRADRGGFPLPRPFLADVHHAHLRLQLDDTQAGGLVAGELPVDTAVASLRCRLERELAEDAVPFDVLEATAVSVADLRPNEFGECQGISWTVEIDAVAATVVREP